MKRIYREEDNTKTAKCPDCGGDYLVNTGYCASCKKKVKKENSVMRDKPLTEKSSDASERLLALAEFLDIVPENIDDDPDWNLEDALEDLFSYEDRYAFTVEYGKQEYLVLTDKEADEEAENRVKDLLDDIGVGGFNRDFVMNFVDSKSFFKDIESDEREAFLDSPDSYSGFFDIKDMKEGIIKAIEKPIKKIYDNTVKKYSSAFLEIEEGEEYDLTFMDDVSPFDTISATYSSFAEFLETMNLEGLTEKELDTLFADWKESLFSDVEDADDDDILNEAKDLDILDDYVDDAVSSYFDEYRNDAVGYLENMYGRDDEAIFSNLENYIDEDELMKDAISTDGRGHFISSYDGEENEQGDYYIYRRN
jgi:hypothetical protein